MFDDPQISQPYLVRSYLAPERDPGNQEEAAALVYWPICWVAVQPPR